MSYMALRLRESAGSYINRTRQNSFRRLWRGSRGGGLRLAFYHPHRPDRAFVEKEQRNGERHLADDVGRRQHSGENEGADDEVTALGLERLGGEDADAAKQSQDDRQLKGDAEGEDQTHHQRQIFADLR